MEEEEDSVLVFKYCRRFIGLLSECLVVVLFFLFFF